MLPSQSEKAAEHSYQHVAYPARLARVEALGA
jgi:hypothetical protein